MSKEPYDPRCQFGIGEQITSECQMIYVHFPGYYITEEAYQDALKRLCPNLQWGDEVEAK